VKIKNRQELLLIVAAVGIVLFLADKVLITPLTGSWKSRTEQIATLKKKVSDGHSLVNRELSLKSRWEQMRTNTLPNNTSQAEQRVLQAFDRWSQESHVSIMSISPQLKHDTDDYMTVELRVEAQGNLNTISRFLYNIERDPMALKLDSVEITSRDTEGQVLAMGLQISGLILTPRTSNR
jgi:hypothetical protein